MKNLTLFLCLMVSVSCGGSGQKTEEGRAEATLRAVLTNFSVQGTNLFRETYPFDMDYRATYVSEEAAVRRNEYSFLWPFSSVLSAVVVMAEDDDRYMDFLLDDMLPGLEEYFDISREPASYSSYIVKEGHSDRYYDDNIWLALDFADIYTVTKDRKYLEKAELIWRFIESGMDEALGGGIYWCEQKKASKNTCSNAPGAVLALKLYRITGDRHYLDKGMELYSWARRNLRDEKDGLYLDAVRLDGSFDRRKFAYNSGQMLQAAVLLCQITGEQSFLAEARELAEACSVRFFEYLTASDGGQRHVLKDGNIWFSAIMLRGFIELYRMDGDDRYIRMFRDSMDYFWDELRDDNGLFRIGKKRDGVSRHLLAQGAMVELYARLENLN